MRLGTYYRAQILKNFHIQAVGKNALDVGGFDGYWLSTQKAKSKYVLDLEVNKLYKNINYIQASALKIPFKTNYFDQVFAFDVLEHIEKNKERTFLKELIRVCKKGGEIILSTPSKNIRMFPHILTTPISKMWGHYKCNGYSKPELASMLNRNKQISYSILANNAPYYRRFFVPIRILWNIVPRISRKLVDAVTQKDVTNTSGEQGFFFIMVRKI